MEIIIKGKAKEVADLIVDVCDRQKSKPAVIPNITMEKFGSYLEKYSNSRRTSFGEMEKNVK